MKEHVIQNRLIFILQAILFAEFVAEVITGEWAVAVITAGILVITLTPLIIEKRFQVFIPSEFVLLSVIFVFASLFLGNVRGYYDRFWWWDIALHTSSGFLLGIIGFLLVFVMNEMDSINLRLNPRFVAFFAFLFALGIGALWEIYEYAMDTLFGMDMQRAMFNDPSGLTDTMWDLIVDTIGAVTISVLGYQYIKSGENKSFLVRWIQAFISGNPRFFRRTPKAFKKGQARKTETE